MTERTTADQELISEYQSAVFKAVIAVGMLKSIDFAKLIRAIDHADAVGPMLDPTAYREKGQAMREDRALLVAAQNLVDKLSKPTARKRRPMEESDV